MISSSNHAVVDLLAGDRERQLHVLLGVQHREQVVELEDEADVLAAQLRQLVVVHPGDLLAGDRDRSARRLVEPGEDVHQRRLARARRAHDGRQLAALDLERDAAERVDRGLAFPVAAGQVVGR